MATYTVKKGDTLSKIASSHNTTVAKLVEINDIENPNYIVVGQVLELSSSSSSTKKKSSGSKVAIKAFGLQSDTDRTVYCSWNWTKSHTKEYKTRWCYSTGDGIWFVGSDSTTTFKQSTYTAPDNATSVKFNVKPISTTHKVNKKDTSYWTAQWSTDKKYSFKSNPPSTPPVPTVSIKQYTLTMELDNLNVNATKIQFQVVKDDTSVYKTGSADIKKSSASRSCSVEAGHEYKVRARAIRGKEYSDWSEYSSNVGTSPATPSEILVLKATSDTSVFLTWTQIKNATKYEVQYTTKVKYFNSNPSGVSSVTIDASKVSSADITGIETGQKYFFRVRAINDNGESGWSEVKHITLGKAPSAPTTWSSATTVKVGDPLTLYWVHNSEDGSSQTYAELELYIDGTKETKTIKNTDDEDEKDKTSHYSIDTSVYTEGTQIQWRVRTAGVKTSEFGDWSVQRTIDIYAPPTLELTITDSAGNNIDTLTSFPFYIKGLAGPRTQAPIGYHVSITAGDSYETVDNIGNTQVISEGSEVYSNYFDIDEELIVEMSAGNIDLENNVTYTVSCSVAMNSGLSTSSSADFTVSWTDEEYEPQAEIGLDDETLSVYIRPYCSTEDDSGNETLVEGITLSVYRRDYDGSFVEIATGLTNTSSTYVTDPHPQLDYARYRIVAITDSTGAVSYYDPPGYPIGEPAVILQWSESWNTFDAVAEDTLEEPPWAGSMLKIPYNIDVSDSSSMDVELVEYIGRKHPVSYYGTQLGFKSTWSMEIPKTDKETLYQLRRLQTWTGDVYVREPSGSGYWASVSVAFSQKHLNLTIPITLTVTRVEGGI